MMLWGLGKANEPKHLLQELSKGESFVRANGRRAKVPTKDVTGISRFSENREALSASCGEVQARWTRRLAVCGSPLSSRRWSNARFVSP